MRLKDIGLKFKALGLRQLLKRVDENGGIDQKQLHNVKKQSWMMPVSHGYHVVEAQSLGGGGEEEESSRLVTDTVVVRREEIANLELWFYGVSNPRIGDDVVKYLQLHLFNKKLKESYLRRKSKEIMKTAYINAEPKLKDNKPSVGSASAIVINGEKLVMAQMGDYRAVLCRDGEAYQLHAKHQHRGRRHWSRKLISGTMRIPKVRMKAWNSRSKMNKKSLKSTEPIVTSEKIDPETEFVILASSGVWQVMRNQEAVDLIRHIDHPQEAAKCLAREALVRMSRRNISCIIIRFD